MKINPVKKKKNRKLPYILPVVTLLLLLGFAYAFFFTPVGSFFGYNKSPTQEGVRGPNSVDYSGPTESDESSSQDAKKNSSAEAEKNGPEAESSNNQTSKKTTRVAISYAGVVNDQIEVRAFVPDTIEGTGTCTATLTKSGYVLERTSQAFIDASSSQCLPIVFNLSEISSKGTWNVVVTYSSPDYEGHSDKEELTI